MLTFGQQFDPAKRGYHAVYRENQVNHCPGCGRTHWYVGRTLAECGFCATALPLAESFRQPNAARVIHRLGGGQQAHAA
ncbi:MAG: hypothetical protein LH466_03460 [Sphingomonas bacterium]|nr:hypothetical protein [Sphingomonas bacterium]